MIARCATVIQYYSDQPEGDRLSSGLGLLEFARSKEIIARYAEWVGEVGHVAHLIDLAPAHIDAVLLLGSLYHLVEREDRVQALREARRVTRRGGWVFAAATCRFAPLLGALVEGFFDDPAFAPVLARDLVDGQHRNTTGDPRRFTTAYFHRPEELLQEAADAGLAVVECLAIEGPCWLAGGSRTAFEECWSEPRRRAALLELARSVERDRMALSASPHVMVVARA